MALKKKDCGESTFEDVPTYIMPEFNKAWRKSKKDGVEQNLCASKNPGMLSNGTRLWTTTSLSFLLIFFVVVVVVIMAFVSNALLTTAIVAIIFVTMALPFRMYTRGC